VLPLFSYSQSSFTSNVSSGLKYFQIGEGVSAEQKATLADELSTADFGAIQFVLTEKRYYPNDTLLSQVLGFVSNSSGHGQYGVEQYFDGDLRGIDGAILGNKAQNGDPLANAALNVTAPAQGENIQLTINAHIQQMVEQKLKYWVDNQKADSGSVIVMNPKTGAIVAMADYPTYDPNQYYNGFILDCTNEQFMNEAACKTPNTPLDSSLLESSFDNLATTFVYEPGSVMKAITASAAIQENKITTTQIFNDTKGYFEASGKKVYNYNNLPDGKMTIADILKLSSNVGASMVAQALGNDLLDKYYTAFGMGQPTGITLQGEQTGTVPDASSWRPIDLATASFGQFIAATPLQVIGIYQTLANGGVRMKPYIVQSITKNGQTIQTQPQAVDQVVSAKTAQTITNMLIYTTTGEPAWGLRNMQQYMPIIASKTGSAQVPDPVTGGYIPNEINATYIGYAPANNPQFVLLAMLKDPRAGEYAATTAVPLWADIASQLFLDYKIPPQ